MVCFFLLICMGGDATVVRLRIYLWLHIPEHVSEVPDFLFSPGFQKQETQQQLRVQQLSSIAYFSTGVSSWSMSPKIYNFLKLKVFTVTILFSVSITWSSRALGEVKRVP